MTTYFKWPIIVTVVGLVLGGWIGWQAEHTIEGALSVFLICAILSVLEISLSFDNAIVNANKLKTMDPVWQRRFLTWGILIAVFGMRVIFPLAIVAVAASISPVEAVRLAWAQPDEYARIMHDAHVAIAAYGGMFLLLVALGYFVAAWLGAPVLSGGASFAADGVLQARSVITSGSQFHPMVVVGVAPLEAVT